MKRLKKILALAIAMAMVVAMALPSFAADPTEPADPTSGTITINSPIVGATYKVYKVFDMTTNAAKDAFSYTIDKDNAFYGAVVKYASDPANGLILTRIEGSDPATYNVSVSSKDNEPETGYKKFDPQKFGQAMQAVLEEGSPKVGADNAETEKPGTGIVAKDAGGAKINENYSKECTITAANTSGQLVFDGTNSAGIPLGYYLINPTYPPTTGVTVTLDETHEFTVADLKAGPTPGKYLDANNNEVELENAILSEAAKTKINDYVTQTVTDKYVDDYIKNNAISTNKDGSPLNNTGKAEYKDDLIKSMKANAEAEILDKLKNTESARDSDINVKKPILVFLDSSQPDAVINEKNELDKWDVPVNPSGTAKPGTPDHGEPEGGKNIVAGETTDGNSIYADWSDAEIGESIHYQLRINAMNFINTSTDGKQEQANAENVQQVKEYILADYQSAHMHYDTTKGIHVSIWQGNNANESQDATKKNVTSNAVLLQNENDANKKVTFEGVAGNADAYLDYSAYADNFFKNDPNSTEDGSFTANGDIFLKDDQNTTGIVVPWVIVSQEGKKSQYPVYTTTNVPKSGSDDSAYKMETIKTDTEGKVPYKEVNGNGDWVAVSNLYVSTENHVVYASDANATEGRVVDTNEDGTLKTNTSGGYEFVQDTEAWYTYSIYNSDVTIVVDYWMILDNDAIVDEPGNKNFAQYGWNPVDNKETNGNPKTPTKPTDEDKPSQKENVDEATAYTYALAWVKIDEKGNELKDAEFTLPFYVKADKNGKPIKDNSGALIFAFMPGDDFDEDTPEAYPEDKSQTPTDGAYPKFTKDNTTNVVITSTADGDGEKGVITIKGVEQGKYKITESKAPAGFNKLTKPFEIKAKKSGEEVVTKTKTTVYFDANGNVTETVTTATKEYKTDVDSYNNAQTTATGEEKSVPVYEYKHILNTQGTTLPSTGGIGTTIFYVVGAILVIGAGVVLITRRRMDA